MHREALLLDTTYILPILGIGVKLENFEHYFKELLDRYRVLYNPVSLIEAKWIVLHLAKKLSYDVLKRYRLGLLALSSDPRISPTAITSYEVEEVADKLLEALNDYFDRIILATAYVNGYTLLSEDEAIHRVAKQRLGMDVLKWRDIVSKFNRLSNT